MPTTRSCSRPVSTPLAARQLADGAVRHRRAAASRARSRPARPARRRPCHAWPRARTRAPRRRRASTAAAAPSVTNAGSPASSSVSGVKVPFGSGSPGIGGSGGVPASASSAPAARRRPPAAAPTTRTPVEPLEAREALGRHAHEQAAVGVEHELGLRRDGTGPTGGSTRCGCVVGRGHRGEDAVHDPAGGVGGQRQRHDLRSPSSANERLVVAPPGKATVCVRR